MTAREQLIREAQQASVDDADDFRQRMDRWIDVEYCAECIMHYVPKGTIYYDSYKHFFLMKRTKTTFNE